MTTLHNNKLMAFLKVAVGSLNQHVAHPQFQRLMEIASRNVALDELYVSMNAETVQVPVVFLTLSSQSTSMAAYVTALVGHSSATTSVSRTALEAALYAYGVAHDRDLLEKWRNPPENRRDKINASTCLRLLRNNHPNDFDEVELIYKDLIDTGGHPTRSSLFRNSNVTDHLHEDGHVYSEAPVFSVDVILEPSSKSISQFVLAIVTHAYALQICALADHEHPKSVEILSEARDVLRELMTYLSLNRGEA